MVRGEIGQTDAYTSHIVLTMRGKSPNWLLGSLIPTTYILGGDFYGNNHCRKYCNHDNGACSKKHDPR